MASNNFKFLFRLISLLIATASAQLSSNFYATTCPNALTTIKSAVASAVKKEARMGASLLRLHFHDCFVNANIIKSQLENLCPGVVSCADILAVAARDSIVALGGPSWTVLLGRRDSTTASQSAVNSNIPSPLRDLTTQLYMFTNKGFTVNETITLLGSHTIGQARCTFFRTRIYNETNIDSTFATSLRKNCPATGGDNNLAPLDATSPTSFDNAYFKNLLNEKGLLPVDQQLVNEGIIYSQITEYSNNEETFRTDFANAMVKMGSLSPLTGLNGQIRKNCRRQNAQISPSTHNVMKCQLLYSFW
ncbi:hypothetical protein SLEP1_g38681 [Rubroshorea leprosula]|uniref:Peroxidase n=1 Tax=Rubroshorea leprosula TaxID=152421 RepID=A0AAV5KY80_9ROSI|nr:hypothetical protein SLEP1_g38681 [Rubroshorea leprosula]